MDLFLTRRLSVSIDSRTGQFIPHTALSVFLFSTGARTQWRQLRARILEQSVSSVLVFGLSHRCHFNHFWSIALLHYGGAHFLGRINRTGVSKHPLYVRAVQSSQQLSTSDWYHNADTDLLRHRAVFTKTTSLT